MTTMTTIPTHIIPVIPCVKSHKFFNGKSKKLDLTGQYIKPPLLSSEDAVILLDNNRHTYYEKNGHLIDQLVKDHYACCVLDCSFNDGSSGRFDELFITVCVDRPYIYEIKYKLMESYSDDDSDEDFESPIYELVNINALWNTKHNVLLVRVNTCDNISQLLKRFVNQPKIITEGIWECLLAY